MLPRGINFGAFIYFDVVVVVVVVAGPATTVDVPFGLLGAIERKFSGKKQEENTKKV